MSWVESWRSDKEQPMLVKNKFLFVDKVIKSSRSNKEYWYRPSMLKLI